MNDATRQRDPRGGSNFIDRTGLRYGSLTVVRRAEDKFLPDKSKKKGVHLIVQWLCVCDCDRGTEVVAEGSALVSGNTTSCGCGRRQPRPGWSPHTVLPRNVGARNRVFKGYQAAARHRGLAWELTDEQFDDLTSRDCHYCGCPPGAVQRGKNATLGDFTYNGIDRTDNTLGYVAGNVVPSCYFCNRAKWNVPYDDFLAWIVRVARFRDLEALEQEIRCRRDALTAEADQSEAEALERRPARRKRRKSRKRPAPNREHAVMEPLF